MKASFVDLRTKSSEILQALNRNEKVTILYRGKPKAVMQPLNGSAAAREKSRRPNPMCLKPGFAPLAG